MSNHISIMGRIGQAYNIIIDPIYRKLIDKKLWFNYKFFTYKGLSNKIILFKDFFHTGFYGHYKLIYSDTNYILDEIGDFDVQYHVLEIKCLKDIRTKKLKRILK